MTAIKLVIDAANIAYYYRDKKFHFARVAAVRTAWRDRGHDGEVHAVIDASVRDRLVDPALAAAAQAEHWLSVAAGDADDEILRMADEYGATVVSRDNFAWATGRYEWLHRDRSRLYGARFSGESAQLYRRPLVELTPEKIAQAKRVKAEKAGMVLADDVRSWRHTDTAEDCRLAGETLSAGQVQRRGDAYYCWGCQRAVTAEVSDGPAGPPMVRLLHGDQVRCRLQIPPEGIRVGRAGWRHPDVTDVTDGLARADARAISGEHLLLKPDHTGLPVAVHLRATNTSFLNPTIGADGLPADHRMAPDVEYPLWPGDEILLGPGLVRLLIDAAEPAR